jgi:hypothetical protein
MRFQITNVVAAPEKANKNKSVIENVLYVNKYNIQDIWNEKQKEHSSSLKIVGWRRIRKFLGTLKM